jgi:hypothetical protein
VSHVVVLQLRVDSSSDRLMVQLAKADHDRPVSSVAKASAFDGGAQAAYGSPRMSTAGGEHAHESSPAVVVDDVFGCLAAARADMDGQSMLDPGDVLESQFGCELVAALRRDSMTGGTTSSIWQSNNSHASYSRHHYVTASSETDLARSLVDLLEELDADMVAQVLSGALERSQEQREGMEEVDEGASPAGQQEAAQARAVLEALQQGLFRDLVQELEARVGAATAVIGTEAADGPGQPKARAKPRGMLEEHEADVLRRHEAWVAHCEAAAAAEAAARESRRRQEAAELAAEAADCESRAVVRRMLANVWGSVLMDAACNWGQHEAMPVHSTSTSPAHTSSTGQPLQLDTTYIDSQPPKPVGDTASLPVSSPSTTMALGEASSADGCLGQGKDACHSTCTEMPDMLLESREHSGGGNGSELSRSPRLGACFLTSSEAQDPTHAMTVSGRPAALATTAVSITDSDTALDALLYRPAASATASGALSEQATLIRLSDDGEEALACCSSTVNNPTACILPTLAEQLDGEQCIIALHAANRGNSPGAHVAATPPLLQPAGCILDFIAPVRTHDHAHVQLVDLESSGLLTPTSTVRSHSRLAIAGEGLAGHS